MVERLIAAMHSRLVELRRDLHAHPELAFEESRTADIVAARLTELGLEVHCGLAKTGVVGTLRSGAGRRAIGLRADMDALPITELNDLAYRSRYEGRMHACGHDGHVAMLLGAAEALAATHNFDGVVHFIFQPAEEMAGGGRMMVEEGLFERFPVEMVFGLHNWPGLDVGTFAIREGPMMAGADTFEITIGGRGGHAGMPHNTVDVVVAGSALVQALQSLVARNTDPHEAAVVSVTRFNAGNAKNVLPEQAELAGTVRMFRPAVKAALEAGMRRICAGIEAAFGVSIHLEYQEGYPPTINAAVPVAVSRSAAESVFGPENVVAPLAPSMGAEDFAFLANAVPGAYGWLGNGPEEGGSVVHSPHYDFNDEAIPLGIRYWVRLVETALPLGQR